MDAGHVGLLDEMRERHFLVADPNPVGQEMHVGDRHLPALGGEGIEPVLDLARRIVGRHAIEVRTGGRRGRRRVRHLGGRRGGDLDPVDVDLELIGQHLRDLGIEPLPHLGAAMVQVHRSVLVDMDQRAGLVERRKREGDAEFHWRQRDTLADHLRGAVEVDDRLAPRLIIRGRLKFLDDPMDDIVLHLLVIGRQAALVAVDGIEVLLADFERIDADGIGDLLYDALAADQPLRAAKAAERGV
jgi:hypothetical protein